MAETQEERQARLLRILKEFTDNLPDEIEEVFFELEELYHENLNAEFWDNVRNALKENKYLSDKEVLFFITKYDLAAQGYWWYDSRKW